MLPRASCHARSYVPISAEARRWNRMHGLHQSVMPRTRVPSVPVLCNNKKKLSSLLVISFVTFVHILQQVKLLGDPIAQHPVNLLLLMSLIPLRTNGPLSSLLTARQDKHCCEIVGSTIHGRSPFLHHLHLIQHFHPTLSVSDSCSGQPHTSNLVQFLNDSRKRDKDLDLILSSV